MKALGAIKGKHARAFAERSKKKDWTISVENNLLPELKPNKSMRIVDFCTGSGNIIPYFKNKVKEFIAVDASKEMVKILRENFGTIKNLRIIQSDVGKVPFDSNKYDAVINKFSLHHIYNADPMVKEAFRIIKKGGKFFVIDCVFEGSFFDRIKVLFVKIYKAFKQGFHELFCRYRNESEITNLLLRNGFKVIKKKNIGGSKTYSFFTDYIYICKK